MYFSEFEFVCRNVSSELYFSIFHCFYNCVPLARKFSYLRCNFFAKLRSQHKAETKKEMEAFEYKQLPTPCLTKSVRKLNLAEILVVKERESGSVIQHSIPFKSK